MSRCSTPSSGGRSSGIEKTSILREQLAQVYVSVRRRFAELANCQEMQLHQFICHSFLQKYLAKEGLPLVFRENEPNPRLGSEAREYDKRIRPSVELSVRHDGFESSQRDGGVG